MSQPIIAVNQLTKTFGSVTALDNLDLTVTEGEVMGFLGPNGAGKSTTIRILLGLLQATRGNVTVFGQDPWQDAVAIHRRLAYVPGDVSLWPGLTGGTCIDILTSAYGPTNKQRKAELLERFNLDPTKKARTYSKGNRQKVSLVAALSVDVDLLVLDEPTSGLDPLMEATFQACLRERTEQGTSVLLSSHILAEVEALADRITIIKSGTDITSGTLADLRRHARTHVHAITATQPDLTAGALQGDALHDIRTNQTGDGFELRCTVDDQSLPHLVGALHHSTITTLTITPPTLDELFMDMYADQPATEVA